MLMYTVIIANYHYNNYLTATLTFNLTLVCNTSVFYTLLNQNKIITLNTALYLQLLRI